MKTSSGLKSAGIISICLKCQMREISQELNSWRPNLSLEGERKRFVLICLRPP